jgi:DNA-directed RNA polymerase subunit omega
MSAVSLATGARLPMIEALKSDTIVNLVGGRFKLCALIQRRLVQLMDGARPMVERNGRSDLELVIEEIVQGKLTYEFDPAAGVDTSKILIGSAE